MTGVVLGPGSAGDAGWLESAACRSVGDPELWFPRAGQPGTQARRVCSGCPVLVECDQRAHVLLPSHGIWAGRTWVDGRPR